MARKPFVILDSEILHSSIWAEAGHIKLMWITMLLICDTEGYVGAALPGIASQAGVSMEQAKEAIGKFMAPDPYSRSQENEGRRIAVVDRGYQILNFTAHVDRLSTERKRARDRMRRWREHGWRGRYSGNIPAPKVGDCCACCGQEFKTPLKDTAVLDHDHQNGQGRAYICRSCNSLVAQVENGKVDRTTVFVDRYLREHGSGVLESGEIETVTASSVTVGRSGNIPAPSSLLPAPSQGQRNQGTTTETRAREGPPANPLIGDRKARESEVLALVREVSALDPAHDPIEILAEAAHYEGAKRQKVNPASMSDDRLLNTILDLQKTRDTLKRQAAAAEAKKTRPTW